MKDYINPYFYTRIIGLTFLILLTTLITPMPYAKADNNETKRLILFQGFILNAYYNGQYTEVKRLPPDGTVYGYGWLDDNRVFVAYQRVDSGEAVADFEVIDLKKSKTTKLSGIGGVGESNFDVNTSTGRIIFSHNNEINELVINEDSKSYKIVPLKTFKQFDYCWAIFWIDKNTVGCKFIHDNKIDFMKYDIPSSEMKE